MAIVIRYLTCGSAAAGSLMSELSRAWSAVLVSCLAALSSLFLCVGPGYESPALPVRLLFSPGMSVEALVDYVFTALFRAYSDRRGSSRGFRGRGYYSSSLAGAFDAGGCHRLW